jgi:predicted hotdog family 3-hydroxylacyl-ACP dehydratase
MTQAFPPMEELLPHRGSMLLLDRVFSENEKSIVAGTTVPEAAWYLDEQGGMPAWIGIELMAQAIAAHAGLRGRMNGKAPKRGVLLGCRAYRARMSRATPGTLLKVSAKMTLVDESGLRAYDCTIEDGAAQFAAATLKVFEPEDFEAFMRQQATPGGGA